MTTRQQARDRLLEMLGALRRAGAASEDQIRELLERELIGLDSVLDPEDVSAMYEELQSLELRISGPRLRDRSGSFYTPEWLVELILDEVLEPILDHAFEASGPKALRALRVCDPSCGTGHFLVAAGERIARRIGRESAGACLFGIDSDPIATHLTRRRIEARFGRDAIVDRIVTADALIDDDLGRLADGAGSGGFDLVIGNPPFGISRGGRISPAVLAGLKRRYRRFLTGKPNTYLLFLGIALESVRDGGSVALLTPDSWLGIRDGTAIRKIIREQFKLSRIHRFARRTFADAGVEVVLPVIMKEAPAASIEIVTHSEDGRESSISSWLGDQRVSLSLDERAIASLNRFTGSTIRLGDPESGMRPAIAAQIYGAGKGEPRQTPEDARRRVFHRASREQENDIPYLEGREIGRFRVAKPSTFVRYGPWVAEYQPLERFDGPRVLVREVLGPLPHRVKAAFIDVPCLYNKSVLHILSSGASREDMLALTAILNSRIASLVFHGFGRKSNRKLFPKLLSADLMDFPRPAGFAAHRDELARLALRAASGEHGVSFESELESAVCAAFGIGRGDSAELERITESLTARGASSAGSAPLAA